MLKYYKEVLFLWQVKDKSIESKKYNLIEKQRIIKEYSEGKPATFIQDEYGIPAGTIKIWKYQIDHNITPNKRGRPKNNEEIDYKENYDISYYY